MLRVAVLLILWASAIYFTLMIAQIPGDLTHGFCGPWGCLPPVQALIAMHTLWLVLLIPPLGWVLRYWTARRLRVLGWVMCGLGLSGVVVVIVGEGSTWLASVPDDWRRFLLHRIAFTIAVATDLPMIQLIFCGFLSLGTGWLRQRKARQRSTIEPIAGAN